MQQQERRILNLPIHPWQMKCLPPFNRLVRSAPLIIRALQLPHHTSSCRTPRLRTNRTSCRIPSPSRTAILSLRLPHHLNPLQSTLNSLHSSSPAHSPSLPSLSSKPFLLSLMWHKPPHSSHSVQNRPRSFTKDHSRAKQHLVARWRLFKISSRRWAFSSSRCQPQYPMSDAQTSSQHMLAQAWTGQTRPQV